MQKRPIQKSFNERASELYYDYANNLDCTESEFVSCAREMLLTSNTSHEAFDKALRKFAVGRLKTSFAHRKY